MLTPPSSGTVIRLEPAARSNQPIEQFVMLRHSLLYSERYQSLPAVAQALYVRIAARYNGRNNGQIPYSARDAKKELHIGQYTAYRAFKKLREQDLIIRRKRGSFVRKTQEAKASEWEVIEFRPARSLEQSKIHQVAPQVPDHQVATQVPADTYAANPPPASSCAQGTLLDKSSKSLDRDKKEPDPSNSREGVWRRRKEFTPRQTIFLILRFQRRMEFRAQQRRGMFRARMRRSLNTTRHQPTWLSGICAAR